MKCPLQCRSSLIWSNNNFLLVWFYLCMLLESFHRNICLGLCLHECFHYSSDRLMLSDCSEILDPIMVDPRSMQSWFCRARGLVSNICTWISIIFLRSKKNVIDIFIGIILNLLIFLSIWTLMLLILPNHEYGKFLVNWFLLLLS